VSSRSVDCDVHVVPTIDALLPHLSPYWRDTMVDLQFRQPTSVNWTYPPHFDMVATSAQETTLQAVQEQVLSSNALAILGVYFGVESLQHPFQGEALASGVNRWLQAEWLDRDPRLLAGAVVTPQYAPGAVEEIERIAADRRFVQVLVPGRSEDGYGNHRYWPIWRAAVENDLAVAITFGGGALSPPTAVGWTSNYFETYILAAQLFQTQIMSFIASGIFDELPELRIVVLESGWTWLPAVMWRMDGCWKHLRRETPWVKELPSEYVRRHFRFATAPVDAPETAAQLADVLEQLGSQELLMYSSDFPHKYGSDSSTLLEVAGPEQAERIRWTNASECYGLEARTIPGEDGNTRSTDIPTSVGGNG
jgi:predicted TIM-barrel fold metal-dependent hydrolase